MIPRLVLHPAAPTAAPESPPVVRDLLRALGLIDREFALAGQTGYLAGPHFPELVVFLGCAPVLKLSQTDGADFCHVSLGVVHPQPEFRVAGQATPRCAICRARVPAWKEPVAAGRTRGAPTRWTCPGCGRSASPHELDWRRTAGRARFFLDIVNVHPHEALPSAALLDALGRLTGAAWDFFYC